VVSGTDATAEPGRPRRTAEPYRHRQVAQSFGADAERYDRTRSGYPADLVHRVTVASPGGRVLDVGCGTGLLARQFQAAGREVLGVEPDPRMAAFANQHGVAAEVATFETWDPAGRRFGAVVSGSAWHWVDPVAGAAKAAQVLAPGGRLALFWHTYELPPPVADALAAAYRRAVPGAESTLRPGQSTLADYQPIFDRVADGIRAAGVFADPEQWRLDWEQSYTRDQWLDRLPTTGTLTRVPADQLAEVLARTGAAIDALGGAFTLPYATVVVTATTPRVP
jgi:SAM-dependent methyltransferase